MEAVGVKRLSVGGALSRLALAAFMKGAREMKDKGGFTWMNDTLPSRDLKAVFRVAVRQPGQRRDRIRADLAQQRGEVVVEALARHQPVAEGQDHDEGLHEGAAARREAEERPDMPAMPGRLGDVELVGRDVGALAGTATDLDVEGAPPLADNGRRRRRGLASAGRWRSPRTGTRDEASPACLAGRARSPPRGGGGRGRRGRGSWRAVHAMIEFCQHIRTLI